MRHKLFRWISLLALMVGALAVMIGLAIPAVADPDDGQWDPTLPKLLSSGAPGEPMHLPGRPHHCGGTIGRVPLAESGPDCYPERGR